MANLKTGLDFYRQDTNRYQDRRIKRLKKDFGCNGISVYDYLICEIYRDKGCFLVWDDSTAFDVAEYFGLKENTVKEIVNYCAAVGLFDKGLLCRESVLSSYSIQQRYIEMCSRAKRKNIKIPEEYAIIPEESFKIPEESLKIPEVCDKVKKSKVNNLSIVSPLDFWEDDIVPVSRLKKIIFENEQAWYETIAMAQKLKPNEITTWLNNFFTYLECTGEVNKSLKDFKSHFYRWMKIELKGKNENQGKTESTTVYRRGHKSAQSN